MCASNWNTKIEYKQKTIYKYEVLLSLPPSYTIHEDFFIKRNYLLSRLINAIFDNFARTGETQKKEGLPFLVAKSSTQQEVMTPSLYIVGYLQQQRSLLLDWSSRQNVFQAARCRSVRLIHGRGAQYYACVFTVFRCVFPRYSLYIVYEE